MSEETAIFSFKEERVSAIRLSIRCKVDGCSTPPVTQVFASSPGAARAELGKRLKGEGWNALPIAYNGLAYCPSHKELAKDKGETKIRPEVE